MMLRGQFRLWVGVTLAMALAVPAHAQGTDASTRQNVVADTGGANRATVEARRQQLFQMMLADPANLDLAFEYAALSEQVGDLEAAISTLERMLIFAPGLPRLQFELGVLYYRLNSWNTAKSYFTTVLDQPVVPDDIRTRIGQYMATIDAQAEGAMSYGDIGIGMRYQTNANAGPASPFVEIGGWQFVLDDAALGSEDWNGYVTARYHTSMDMEGQGDRFDFDVSAYGALHAEQSDLDTGVIEFRLGPNFNLAAIGLDNARLALHGDFGAALLSGVPYVASAGVGADLTMLLDARTRVTLSTGVRHEQFYDSDLRPNSSDRTGQTYAAGSRVEYLLTPDVALFTSLDLNRKVAEVDYLNSWQGAASVGFAWSFAGPGGGEAPWTLSLSGGVSQEVADAPDPIISTDAETRLTGYATIGLVVPVAKDVAINTTLTYSETDSNYDLSNFDNLAASVGVSKRF
jgi:tetratricopeptide (TPR) repeat protein